MKVTTLLARLLHSLQFMPMLIALLAARAMALMPPRRRLPQQWGRGLSILIPESGTPDLLDSTLAHAEAALAQVNEESEIVVLVNGAEPSIYAELQNRFPKVFWHFFPQTLGFNGAIEAGLVCVQYPATYLLNSDMRLAPDALVHLLRYRSPGVFALASQIFFPEGVRREETGWSDYEVYGGRSYTFERTPELSTLARGTLYASGGSSLFQTALLKEYVKQSRDYSPFYWEDADWGARAWADGLECLFVPQSTAMHEHRGTIKRRYEQTEIDRIIDRNGLLFELRHHLSWLDGWRAISHLSGRHPTTRKELCTLRVAHGVYDLRRQSMARRLRGFSFKKLENRYVSRAIDPALPVVLWVTPFSVFPPSHGGARRIAELAKCIARHVNLILLSDEWVSYDLRDPQEFALFQSVYLLQGRRDKSGQSTGNMRQRLRRHAPEKLRHMLRELQQIHSVALVQTEFMEAAALVQERLGATPFVASLHDVYLGSGQHDALQRSLLAQFDTVVACSEEDASLLDTVNYAVIKNGANDRLDAAKPSPANGGLLFMGPFRYKPNHTGILAFLRECWPLIRAECPRVTLTILAGSEAKLIQYGDPLLQQGGVNVVRSFVDPASYLANCAITINPQQQIRGSALKVAESLLAHRVCVSTLEGARGFADLQGKALQVANDWQAMAQAIIKLLQDVAMRHQLEISATLDRRTLSWQGQADRLLDVYAKLIPGFTPNREKV